MSDVDDHTTELHPGTGIVFERLGSGPPLVLIHGLGSSRRIWTPVQDTLAAERDLVLIDLPGFGESPALPGEQAPTATALADCVTRLLDDLGLERPHVAGHSLGGWVALEIAARGRASSVTAIAPAGLWRRSLPLSSNVGLRAMRVLSRVFEPVTPTVAHSRIARTAVLWPQSGRPWAAPTYEVIAQAQGYARCPGFGPTLDAMVDHRFTGAAGLDLPVTVAFGSRDLVMDRWQSQDRAVLPASTRWVTLPGCGHVPQWDDPAAVARLLIAGSASPMRSKRHPRSGRSH